MKQTSMAALMLLFASNTWAGEPSDAITQGTGFAGLTVSNFMFDNDSGASADFNALALNGGYFVVDNLAVELEAGAGLDDESDIVPGDGEIEFEIKSYVSGYVVGHLPIHEKSSVYAKIGTTYVKMNGDQKASTLEDDFSEVGFSYGAGLQAHPTSKMSLFIGYQQLVNDDQIDMHGVTAGIRSHF